MKGQISIFDFLEEEPEPTKKDEKILYDDLRILIELKSDLDAMYFNNPEYLEKYFALSRAIDRMFSEINKGQRKETG